MANETKRDGASHVLFSNVVRFIGVLVLACHGGCLYVGLLVEYGVAGCGAFSIVLLVL